jgi:hypothetical protein
MYRFPIDVEDDGSARFVGDEGEGGVDDEKKRERGAIAGAFDVIDAVGITEELAMQEKYPGLILLRVGFLKKWKIELHK